MEGSSSPFGFPSRTPSAFPRGLDSPDAGDSFTQQIQHFPGLFPTGDKIPLSTFAFTSKYSNSMNTSRNSIESFPHLSSSPTGTDVSRPISCPARGRSQEFVGRYYPQSVLHQGIDMEGSSYPGRLSSSPNNFSNTRHTQTGSCFSQSNSSSMTSVTGTSFPWGSGVNPYNSDGYSGNQSLANKIASSLSKYRSFPIKRKSEADLGSPVKVYLSEKKMAARMENLSINDNKRSVTLKDIEDRLSSEDEDGDVVDEESTPQIRISKDLSDKLKKQAKDEILPKSILEDIASMSYKPCMEMVLWKPPGGFITDFFKQSVENDSDESSNPTEHQQGTQVTDVSMDAADEVLPERNIWGMPETLIPQPGPSSTQASFFSHAALNSTAMPSPAGHMAAMNSAMPSVGVAPGFPPARNIGFGGVNPAAGMRNQATNCVNVPPPNPIPVQNQFLEDNNNCISQQDLFDNLDDDMDL